MTRWSNLFRAALSLTLLLPAALLLLLVVSTPLLLREDAAENRQYHAYFERAASYATSYRKEHGTLPDTLRLRAWARHQGFGWWAESVSIDPIGCSQEGFAPAAGDVAVLGIWRGEFSDCYALPSGKSTLALSTGAFLRSGIGLHLALFGLVAAILIWSAWRMRPRLTASA